MGSLISVRVGMGEPWGGRDQTEVNYPKQSLQGYLIDNRAQEKLDLQNGHSQGLI